eukprot:m51a1_g5404 hypothetical protein (342) ;mRNA; r:71313-72468
MADHFSAIVTPDSFRRVYSQVDVSRVEEGMVRRPDPEITDGSMRDLPETLREVSLAVLTAASATNWAAGRIDAPRTQFTLETLRCFAVAANGSLSVVPLVAASPSALASAPESPEPSAEKRKEEWLSPERLMGDWEARLKHAPGSERPADWAVQTWLPESRCWAVTLVVHMSKFKETTSPFPLIAQALPCFALLPVAAAKASPDSPPWKVVAAWQSNARAGVGRAVMGAVTSFDHWWFCQFEPSEGASFEAPAGTVTSSNPLDFANVELPAGAASGAGHGAWEFVPHVSAFEVLGILRSTLTPNVHSFTKAMKQGKKGIDESAKRAMARATFKASSSWWCC